MLILVVILILLSFFVSFLLYEYLRIKKMQQQLVKQNLIYLVSVVNLLTWVKDGYKAEALKFFAEDVELLEFLKTSGVSIKLLLEKVDRPVTTMHNVLLMRGEEVLNDLKKPLQKEINELLNNKYV